MKKKTTNSVNQSLTHSRIVTEKSRWLDQGYSAYKGYRTGKECYPLSEKGYQEGNFPRHTLLCHEMFHWENTQDQISKSRNLSIGYSVWDIWFQK